MILFFNGIEDIFLSICERDRYAAESRSPQAAAQGPALNSFVVSSDIHIEGI
jgi:hypothetical protein